MPHERDLDQVAINTIRTLAIDAIEKANSGHPGTPIGAAPTPYTLWQRILRYDPEHPDWLNRDRFVLSSGHASMLLYGLIHLWGIKAIKPSYEKVGPCFGNARRHQDVQVGREPLSRSAGIRLRIWRRNHDRSPCSGSGHQRWDCDRRALSRRNSQ
jgi:hypothetical protein